MNKFLHKTLILLILVFLSSCQTNKKESREINIYSQRHYAVDELQYENFTKMTGIKVNVTKANADELIQRLKIEGSSTSADLFITVDVGKLWQAGDMGLLQKIEDETMTSNIKKEFLDPNNFWVPLTFRSRIIVYSKDRVDVNELDSYESLADEKWKNRLLIRSSSNSYNQALMSSIIANNGPEAAEQWSSDVVSNLARDPKGNDRDQVKAIAAGQGDLAVVNSYYIGLLLSSEKEDELNAGNSVGVFFPNQGIDQSGAHINVSGIALTKNSPNKENALKLIAYLTSSVAQQTYVDNTYEYSVNPEIEPNKIVKQWGDFKKDNLDLNMLGVKRNEAIRIFDKTGWK